MRMIFAQRSFLGVVILDRFQLEGVHDRYLLNIS